MQQGTRNVSRAINLFWENSVKIHKWQWAARRSQCYWLNFKRGIPKKTLTLRPLDYTQLRFTVYLHNLFTTPATVIWHKTSPLFYATKSTIWPTAATFSYRNTQPHFTLFHYNSLISLNLWNYSTTTRPHGSFIHWGSVASCTQENQFLIRTLSFFLNMERNVFD